MDIPPCVTAPQTSRGVKHIYICIGRGGVKTCDCVALRTIPDPNHPRAARWNLQTFVSVRYQDCQTRAHKISTEGRSEVWKVPQ